MDIGKAFTFMFEDENWITKILIGGLFILASFVLVGIPFLLGYLVDLLRNIMRGIARPLPEWDNLGDKFSKGLMLALIFIVWLIPTWILSCVQTAVSAALDTGPRGGGEALVFLTVCLVCLNILWGIVVSLFTPAIFVRFAERPEFRSGFEFQAIWEFTRDNIVNIIIAVVLGWVASIASMLGLILCVIGVIFTVFWYYLVQIYLYGEVWRNRRGALPEIVPATTI